MYNSLDLQAQQEEEKSTNSRPNSNSNQQFFNSLDYFQPRSDQPYRRRPPTSRDESDDSTRDSPRSNSNQNSLINLGRRPSGPSITRVEGEERARFTCILT